jgi:Tfp pilus assembly protein PilE
MGQQQLLLIVLGVIIVGIAVVVGINVFTASSMTANNDAVIADLQTIGAMAQQYYRKPTAMGGGGNSFVGFEIPPALENTANGSYAITGSPTASLIVFTGTGNETNNSGDAIEVVYRCTQDSNYVASTNVND